MKQTFPALVCTSLIALFTGPAFGQSESAPTFDLADVHNSVRSSTPNVQMRNGFYRGGRYEIRSATMVDLISLAYGVDAEKILGGPAWLETDRFDVIATAPVTTNRENLRAMLQNLLADRFGLKLHIDRKESPALALTAGKEPKLKESEGSGQTGCNFEVQQSPGGPPTLYFKCTSMSMAALAEYMRGMPAGNQFHGGKPIVDETGLKGTWNFEFHLTLPNGPGGGGVSALSDIIDKQLGLKLEARTVPLPVIFVDAANQKPAPNLPGLVEKLPSAPTEFEVATLKPTDPNATSQNRTPFQPGGRLDLRGGTLKQMISVAWEVPADKILGVPKSLEEDKYDILAKAPASATTLLPSANQNGQPPFDIDALRMMLRTLLMDRFGLKLHTEDRPGDAYTLVAAKPKLKPADPSNRTGFKEGPGPDGKDPRKTSPMLSRLVAVQNMTMAQLADALPRIAGGYFQNANTTVIDATGVVGSFDFTLSFSPVGILRGGGGGRGGDGGGPAGPGGAAGAGGVAEAADPGGGISLFDAMEKQIGIKMEIQKRPMPVLVVDHINPKPTDN